MTLKRTTHWKFTAVKSCAAAFGIPITVHEQALPEVVNTSIDLYIDECSYLLEHVHDGSPSQIAKFQEWAYDFMLTHKYSPYLLHDHPLYFVGDWLGIRHFTPEYDQTEKRFQELVDTNENYKQQFKDGWRVAFGKSYSVEASH